MTEPTHRIPEHYLGRLNSAVIVNFLGGTVTSDAGLIVGSGLESKRFNILLAACFQDYRDHRRNT